MESTIFLPKKYEELSKNELIVAFFSEYYELIIAVDDNTVIEAMLDYIKKSNNNISCDNEMFWKHLWLSYLMYVMQRMKYNYCYDLLSKEKLRLNETSNETFLRLLAVVNVSSKLLTRGDAVIEAPRLLDCLLGDHRCQEECAFIFEKAQPITELVNDNKDVFNFKAKFFNESIYFDCSTFVIYTLTMLYINANIEAGTIFNCISGVLKDIDESKLNAFCNKLYNILSEK